MIKDVHWNNIDNLLCAILVYIPLKTYSTSKSLEDFYVASQEVKPTPEGMGEMAKTAYAALEIIRNSERYKNLKVGHISALYFITYGITRFFIESMRQDSLMLGSFKVAQLVSLGLVIIGAILFIKQMYSNKLYNSKEK